MSKDKLLRLCGECAADLAESGYTVVELPTLPMLGQCELCAAQRRRCTKALQTYAVGKSTVDRSVEKVVPCKSGDSAATPNRSGNFA